MNLGRRSLAFLSAVIALLGPAPGVLGAAPLSPLEDGTFAALVAIAGRGVMNPGPYSDLQFLSDRIGARLTGSDADHRAASWALEKMKAAGLSNVHAEKYSVERGWTRLSASLEVLSPVRRTLAVASFGWAGSTRPGGIEADVQPVELGRFIANPAADTGGWAGKALFVRIAPGTSARAYMLEILRAAAEKARAAGILFGPFHGPAAGMQLLHTSSPRNYSDTPMAAITEEGHAQIGRLLDSGEKVRIRLDVQNRVSDGPVESSNVVGEIPGTERPAEVVLVGAHLDSWDLADGATDNGFGVAGVLGAAEAIASCGHKPRRTIRFALFTGEEQGLLGSVAYSRAHRLQMRDFVAALILDSGPGPITTFNLAGRTDLIPSIAPFTRAVRAFGDIALDEKTEFGTDTLPFTLEGVPAINLDQDSPEYDRTHHSTADTFDKVRADNLLRDATLLALTAYWIAARPERLATPWPPEKTARMLLDLGEVRSLKMFGLWPFGDAK